MQKIDLSDLEMVQLREQLGRLPEPRGGRRQLHPLPTVLTIALAATLAGARGYLAISEYAALLTQTQLKRLRAYFDRRQQRFVAPSEPTFRRVLQQVDPVALEQAFSAWVQASAPADEPLAIDGKTLKGARRDDGRQTICSPPCSLNRAPSWPSARSRPKATKSRPCGSCSPPCPSRGVWSPPMRSTPNARPPASWSRKRVRTTCSRSRTTRKPWPTISRPSTGNPFPPEHTTVDKGHGRIEQRTLRTTVALNAYLDFPHVGQICRIERQVTVSKTGRTRTEQIFCITDLTPEQADPGQLLALNRGHWSIENRLHWVRDVTFDEDRCQVRKGHGPQVLACLRNAVIGLLRRLIRQPRQSIASMIRHFAAHPAQALAVFLR